MSLGKRPRPSVSMRRTESLRVIEVAPLSDEVAPLSEDVAPPAARRRESKEVSPVVAVPTAQFLKACGLCMRRLGPGQDTFIYRGEVAFCSLECRQQQINIDDQKAKCPARTTFKADLPSKTTESKSSSSNGTVAAA